ncbi:MAG: hypothetical protein ABW199_04560, partial [Caulobacterales bacterium]
MPDRPVSPKKRGAGAAQNAVEDATRFLFDVEGAAEIAPGKIPGATPVRAAPADPLKPHYHDHRSRLRNRFAEAGAGALADYELLELLLFRVIPRRDTKPLAKALIARFGDLAGVLGAETGR